MKKNKQNSDEEIESKEEKKSNLIELFDSFIQKNNPKDGK